MSSLTADLTGLDLSTIPLQENPDGSPPNYVDPPSLEATVQAVGITFGLIALALIVVRLLACRRAPRSLALDDGMLHPHLLTSLAALVLLTIGRSHKTCMGYANELFGYALPQVHLCFYHCMPHPGQPWDLRVLSNCNNLATPGLVQAGANILADIGIFALPIPVVIKLQMPLKRKVAVCGIFMTGFLALVCSAITLYYRERIIQGFDISWAGAQTQILIESEIYATIIVACMPSLAGFWKINISDTRLYKGLQSLISLAKRSSLEVKNTNHNVHEDNSSSSLDRQASADASNTNKRVQDQEVY
ncbi:plasma membrane protein Pth11 [Apiospora aurea]|uniref:Plasma membrane protein Pth11 n=1 Tax=Apiospora aurea TaxID=335848 RepID=A0ABR1Q1D6_9PEZI